MCLKLPIFRAAGELFNPQYLENGDMHTTEKRQETARPILTGKDAEMARVAQRCIMESLDHSRAASITLTTDTGAEPSVAIPPQALRFIGQVLGAMSEGQSVMIIPDNKEFSTVEASNFLNVSRPFVIKEIDAGRIPHRMVGTHRRIAFRDLLDYATRMRTMQADALEHLSENTRELGLDY